MGAAYLQVLDFDGLGLTGTDFEACFLVDFDIASQFPLEAVLSEVPGDFPSFVRGDPQDRVVPLEISVNPGAVSTQALIDEMKSTFSPFRDPGYLRVLDQDGNTRRMLVKSLGLTPWEGHSDNAYVASLQAPEPIWEADTPIADHQFVSGTVDSWNLTNGGNERTYPTFELTPQVLKGNGNDFIRRWPITIAWRSGLDGVDSQGLGYPIDIVDSFWDTATEVAAARMRADGDDIKVLVDGVDTDRYLDAINTAATGVWCSIAFQPAKQATLAPNFITPGNPGSGGTLDVSNPEGTLAFPESGILLIGTEAITYNGKTPTSFLDIRRGQRSTTAAGHLINDAIWWVEHDIVILTNYSAAANPAAAADREPIINLTASTNLEHHYTTAEGLIEPSTLRTGQWRREQRRTDHLALALQLYQSAGVIHIEDTAPEAGKPNFDALALYAPCQITDAGADAITLDYQIEHDMLLDLIGIDLEGFEVLMRRRDIRAEAVVERFVGTPAFSVGVAFSPSSPLASLILHGINARVCGAQAGGTGTLDLGDSLNSWGQGLVLDGPTDMRMWRVRALESPSACDKNLLNDFQTLDPAAGPVDRVAPTETVPNALLTTSLQDISIFVEQTLVDEQTIALAAGAYIIECYETGGSIEGLSINRGPSNSPRYARQSAWQQTAGAWSKSPGLDLEFAVCSGVTSPQNDAQVGTGKDVQFRNVIVKFTAGVQPDIVVGSPQDCYYVQATLENVTTGQELQITYPMLLTTGTLVIDCDNHRVLYGETGGHEIEVPGAMEPGDLADWVRLEPGVNVLRWSEPSIGAGQIQVSTTWRDRWS